MLKKILLHIKKRLYLYVAADFIAALFFGLNFDVQKLNIKPISVFVVFLMLYPMLTGMMVEKVKKAGSNYKLISLTLFFAFIIASVTAFALSRTVFANNP